MICTRCGADIPADSPRCEACGEPTPQTTGDATGPQPRIQPASLPEQPRLSRMVIISIGAIALAFAILIGIAAFVAVVRMIG